MQTETESENAGPSIASQVSGAVIGASVVIAGLYIVVRGRRIAKAMKADRKLWDEATKAS